MPINVKLQQLQPQTFICDNSQLNSALTRVLCKSSNGYWHGIQVNFDGSGSYSGSNASMAGVSDNSTSQRVSVVCGASDILGAAANYTTLIYEGKAWFDSGGQTNDMDNAQSYFGREIARSLGGTISAYSSTGATPSLNDQINDMYETYDNGGWVTTLDGVPFNNLFSNASGNGVPKIEAYWNFTDGTSFRTGDAHGGGPVTIFDKAESHNLTVAGSTPSSDNVYNEGPSNLEGGMMGLDWSQGVGQGSNYATCSTTIPVTSSADVCVFFYLGKRTANTTSTAGRYVWDCRQGGGKYMLTNSSGEAFDWQGNISGGTPSGLTDANHFMTAVADPTGQENGEEIRVSYDQFPTGQFYVSVAAVSAGNMNSGMNIVGSDFTVATNANNLGASKYPGPFSILGIMKVPGACWTSDITSANREKLIKMLHMHHQYMLSTNMP